MVEKNFVDVAIQKLIDEDRKYLFIFAWFKADGKRGFEEENSLPLHATSSRWKERSIRKVKGKGKRGKPEVPGLHSRKRSSSWSYQSQEIGRKCHKRRHLLAIKRGRRKKKKRVGLAHWLAVWTLQRVIRGLGEVEGPGWIA
jgi:hypothetical protein